MINTRSRRLTAVLIIALALAASSAIAVHAIGRGGGQSDIAKVRGAVAQYHNVDRAQADGWGLVPDLDNCFESDAGGMGYHYINGERLEDLTVDPLRPEALVYHELPNGKLKLGAVEYVVPVGAWHAEHGEDAHPPEVLGQHLHELEPIPGLHIYGLHVWLFTQNPSGMFADWNPRVSCLSD